MKNKSVKGWMKGSSYNENGTLKKCSLPSVGDLIVTEVTGEDSAGV